MSLLYMFSLKEHLLRILRLAHEGAKSVEEGDLNPKLPIRYFMPDYHLTIFSE